MEAERDVSREAGPGSDTGKTGATSLPDGLYRVDFRIQSKQASGVVIIHGDSFAGGDSGMAYYGSLSRTGRQLRAIVTTLRHTDTGGIPLLGADNLEFVAEGQATGDGATFSGASPSSGQRFELSLFRLRTPGLGGVA